MFGISGFNEEVGRGSVATCVVIDPTGVPVLLEDLIDIDELDQLLYERNLMRHYTRPFKTAEDVMEGEFEGHPVDFRDSLDAPECDCDGEHVCIKCCTRSDLVGVPEWALRSIQVNNRRVIEVGGRLIPVFDIAMWESTARSIGLVA